jgi:hypothetical protein
MSAVPPCRIGGPGAGPGAAPDPNLPYNVRAIAARRRPLLVERLIAVLATAFGAATLLACVRPYGAAHNERQPGDRSTNELGARASDVVASSAKRCCSSPACDRPRPCPRAWCRVSRHPLPTLTPPAPPALAGCRRRYSPRAGPVAST